MNAIENYKGSLREDGMDMDIGYERAQADATDDPFPHSFAISICPWIAEFVLVYSISQRCIVELLRVVCIYSCLLVCCCHAILLLLLSLGAQGLPRLALPRLSIGILSSRWRCLQCNGTSTHGKNCNGTQQPTERGNKQTCLRQKGHHGQIPVGLTKIIRNENLTFCGASER